jgi:hypothetical protein
MLTILCLTKINKSTVDTFNKSYIDYNSFKLSLDVNDQIICIFEDEEGNTYPVNFSKMMQEKSELTTATTWSQVEAFVTEEMAILFHIVPVVSPTMAIRDGGVISVKTPFNTEGNNQLNILSVNYTDGIIVDYGTVKDPSLRNLPNRRHALKDLIFRSSRIDAINLNNTIPVTGGIIHYPVVFNDELYAINAAAALKTASVGGVENVLIDFSPLGDIEIVKFSDCTNLLGDRVTFKLPVNKTFENKTCFLVVAGRLIFPDEFLVIGDNTVSFVPEAFGLDSILISNNMIRGTKIRNTLNVKVNVDDYIGTIGNVDNTECFIIILNTPKILINKIECTFAIHDRLLRFPTNAGGLLMNKVTREIVDYSRQKESDSTTIFIGNKMDFTQLINDDSPDGVSLGYLDANGKDIESASIKSTSESYHLIDIMTR